MSDLHPAADFDPRFEKRRVRSSGARRQLLIRSRIRQGISRMRASWWPLLQGAVAGSLAYWFASAVLHHSSPMFAPIAAFVTLGFTGDRELRKMVELGTGVALGVGLGDLVVHHIGSGIWQLGLVLFVAAMTARFLDRGIVLTMQAGVQSLVIVVLPAGAAGGPLGRWTDALVGLGFALLMWFATPLDPRRKARIVAHESLTTVAEVVRHTALAVRFVDAEEVKIALSIGRRGESALADWQFIARSATDFVRIAPAAARVKGEMEVLAIAAERTEVALRNARVLARRAYDVVEHQVLARTIADYLDDVAIATDELANALRVGDDPAATRAHLEMIASRADPYKLGEENWLVQALALMVRPLVVDLLEAAGADPNESRAALPEF